MLTGNRLFRRLLLVIVATVPNHGLLAGSASEKLNAVFVSAEGKHLLVEHDDLIYFFTPPRIEEGFLCHSDIVVLPSEFRNNAAAFVESFDGFQIIGAQGGCESSPLEYFRIYGDTETAVATLKRLSKLVQCAQNRECVLPSFSNLSSVDLRRILARFENTDVAEVSVSDSEERATVRMKSKCASVAYSNYVELGSGDERSFYWIDELVAPSIQ